MEGMYVLNVLMNVVTLQDFSVVFKFSVVREEYLKILKTFML